MSLRCPKTGSKHSDFDFDGEGLSTTGCDCRIAVDDELDSMPTEDGPEGEESYDDPEGGD